MVSASFSRCRGKVYVERPSPSSVCVPSNHVSGGVGVTAVVVPSYRSFTARTVWKNSFCPFLEWNL